MPDRAGDRPAAREASIAVIREPAAARQEKTYEIKARHEEEELQAMTVPEENRPKTDTTDEVLEKQEATRRQEREAAEGRTMREALEDAEVRPEDFEGER
jgi:hypothetical protein